MQSQTLWALTFSMNEEGRKQLEAVAKKLNTTPSDLVGSIINHGISAMYDCVNSQDPLKCKRAVFKATLEESSKQEENKNPKAEAPKVDEVPGLENFTF